MFIVLLSFGANKHLANEFIESHKAWIKQGLSDKVFLLVGSKQPIAGGCILAAGESLEALQERVACDPFVAQGIVTAEIIHVTPHQLDERLAFIKE